MYVAVAGVPFLSTRFTVTAGASPVNDFSGVNVTFPSFATSYLPTPLTSLTVLPSSNVAGTSLSIGTSGFPGVNLGVPVCTFPWRPVDLSPSAVGVTGVTVGVYFAVVGVPFASFTCTVAGFGVPTKSLFGVNVTFPDFGSILYLPTSFPSFVAGISFSVTGFPSTTNCAGCSSVIVIGTSLLPGLNVGVPSWVLPWIPVDSVGVPVGVTDVTVGVYVAVVGVPFSSFACTVTGSGVPTKSLFGMNVTVPVFGSILYLPTSLPSLVAGTSVSVIGSFVTGL